MGLDVRPWKRPMGNPISRGSGMGISLCPRVARWATRLILLIKIIELFYTVRGLWYTYIIHVDSIHRLHTKLLYPDTKHVHISTTCSHKAMNGNTPLFVMKPNNVAMCSKYLVASNSLFFVPDGLPDRVGLPDGFGHGFHSLPMGRVVGHRCTR